MNLSQITNTVKGMSIHQANGGFVTQSVLLIVPLIIFVVMLVLFALLSWSYNRGCRPFKDRLNAELATATDNNDHDTLRNLLVQLRDVNKQSTFPWHAWSSRLLFLLVLFFFFASPALFADNEDIYKIFMIGWNAFAGAAEPIKVAEVQQYFTDAMIATVDFVCQYAFV